MRIVSRFESDLLRVLQMILDKVQRPRVEQILYRNSERPEYLSRDAVDLVQQTLASGCTSWLLSQGAWQRDKFLAGDTKTREQQDRGNVVQGRLWERRAPRSLGFTFSPITLDLLIWITAKSVNSPQQLWQSPAGLQPTLGDNFFMFLAYRALRGMQSTNSWIDRSPIRHNGLAALAFADDWGMAQVDYQFDWSEWIGEPGAALVEALQGLLACRWLEMEHSKAHIRSAERMRAVGTGQRRILSEFLGQAAAADRRDLARFLLQLTQELLTDARRSIDWIQSLDVDGLRVAEKLDTYRAAMATISQLKTLRDWSNQARSIAFYDSGYASSQLWKSDWEEYQGERFTQRAQQLMHEIEPLAQ